MVGELAHPRARLALRELLDRFGHCSVDTGSPRGGQIVVEGVRYEGMREGVALTAIAFAQQLGTDGSITELEEVATVDIGYSFEHIEAEVPSDHGGQGENVVRLDAERAHPLADDFADADRETGRAKITGHQPPTLLVPIDSAAGHQVTQEFADEERIPVGFGGEGVSEGQTVGIHRMSGDQFQKRQQFVVAEPPQGQPCDSVFAVQRRQSGGQRVGRSHVGVAEGAH